MKEYKVMWIGEPHATGAPPVEARLNEEAALGWKLVCIYPENSSGYATFERDVGESDETNK